MVRVIVEERSNGEVPRAVAMLLDAAGLPSANLDADGSTFLLTAMGQDRVVGAAAVERYGGDGLLRSVVVERSRRGTGVGRGLVASAEAAAIEAGVRALYLLTEGADAFFSQLGYRTIGRGEVPPAVQASEEYSVLCPVDATVMTKRLDV